MSRPDPQSHSEVAGDDMLLSLTATDVSGVAVDITGFGIKAVISIHEGSAALLSTETSPATLTGTITTAASGLFTLAASDVNTLSLLGTYAYQVELTDGASDKKVVNRGYITFHPKMA